MNDPREEGKGIFKSFCLYQRPEFCCCWCKSSAGGMIWGLSDHMKVELLTKKTLPTKTQRVMTLITALMGVAPTIIVYNVIETLYGLLSCVSSSLAQFLACGITLMLSSGLLCPNFIFEVFHNFNPIIFQIQSRVSSGSLQFQSDVIPVLLQFWSSSNPILSLIQYTCSRVFCSFLVQI